MKKTLLLAAILGLTLHVHALPFAWARMLQPTGGYGESKPRGIRYHQGAIYVFGSFKDEIDLDPGASTKLVQSYNTYSHSGYLAKYDLLGNMLWGGSLKGIKTGNPNCIAPPYNEVMDLVFDNNHDLYITGYYDDSVRFEFGGQVKGLRSPCGVSSFMIKVDPGGDVLQTWQVTGLQCPTYFSGLSVALDPNQTCVYTLTDFYGTGDFDFSAGTKIYDHQIYTRFNLVMARYTKSTMALEWSGMLQATKTLNGARILVDQQKNMVVTGKFIGSMDIDPGPGTQMISSYDTSHFDYFVVKYDSLGAVQWVNQCRYGGSFDFDVAMGQNGGLVLASNFSDHVDWMHNGSAAGTLTSNGASADLHCAKMDANGNVLWMRRIGGTYADYFQGLSLAADDRILLTGWFNIGTSLDPLSTGNDYPVNGYATNGMMICLSPAGNFLFGGVSKALENPNNNGIGGATYVASVWDPSGNLYLAGTNIWQSDVDPDTSAAATGMVNNANNNFNSYIMRLGNLAPSNTANLAWNETLRVFPSPARDHITVETDREQLQAVQVFSLNGQCVFSAWPQSRSLKIDVSHWANGRYILRHQTGKGTSHAGFQVQH
jgi:hypothetical protein